MKPGHRWQSVPFDANRPAAELSAQKLLALGFRVPTAEESIRDIMISIGSGKLSVDLDARCFRSFQNNNIRNILITGGAGFIGKQCFNF